MDKQDLHVIVIGAGITGLITCQALKKVSLDLIPFSF